jgi:cysteine-rich repeat protein
MAWTRGWGIVALLAAALAGCGDSGEGPDADGDGGVETDGEADVTPGDDGGAEEAGPQCGNGVVELGEECDDGNLTPGDGCEDCLFNCHDPADCDDGLDCTRDACEAIATGLLCTHAPVAGACVIAGSCYAESDLEPGNPCHVCAPATDPDGWSNQAEGTSCEDGLFCNGAEACDATGACLAPEPGCPTDPCATCDETTDACIPAGADTVCRPAVSECDFEETCDGTSYLCPADEIVAAGRVCRASRGSCDPEEVCTGVDAACPADEIVAAGTACDDLDACSLASACDAAGTCVGTSFPAPGLPRPFLPQNGVLTGSPYAPARFNTLRPTFRWQDPPWDGCPTPAYDLQIDDSCTSPGFETCAFPSPEADVAAIVGVTFVPPTDLPVSATAPVGRRYYWRMRACRGTSCSAWTPVRYLDVGRALQDFNGDGYSDVVVGAPSAGGGSALLAGAAFVYAGSATGITPTAALRIDNPMPQTGALFGWSVASAGDLNADGYADLVVGAPSQDAPAVDEGNVFVFLGAAAGLPTVPTVVLDSPLGEPGADFGRSVAGAGDVDGDGFADLLVGAPGTDGATLDDGAAYLFYGSAAGVALAPDVTLADRDGEPGGAFGAAVATAGDLNADGYADLVVGAPLADSVAVDEGRAWVFLGSATGPVTATALRLDDPGSQAGAHFGWSVATAGDINVNGNSELLVGAPGQSNFAAGEGNIFVYYGTPSGVPATPSGLFDNPLDQAGASEGVAAGVGDVNGDINPDVVVGAWLEDNPETDEGTAYVYHGCYCGVIRTATPTVTLDDPRDGTDDRFATTVSGAGDVNGDGFADVIVGAPGPWGVPFTTGGAAYLYLGSTASIPLDPSTTIPDPASPILLGGFGMSVE